MGLVPGALIEIRGLGKQIGGETALADVTLDIARGEVHGLVGAIGAGKSTLIRCLAGVTVANQGHILVSGEELRQGSPHASEKAGLAFIHQELNLVGHFSALENMLLGARKSTRFGLIDWERSSGVAKAAARRVGIEFPLSVKVSELSVAERWLVMISKALIRDAAMIAMDEPTASLSRAESEQLFGIIRDLSSQGVAILYVSHRLDEVLGLSDRITVLRDGRVVDQAVRGMLDKKGLIRAIIGHDVKGRQDRRSSVVDRSSPPIFSARAVKRGQVVKGVSFDVYKGEILALGGLVGSGRTEIARLAFGVDRLEGGHFELDGERLSIRNVVDAVKTGIALVPEERRSQGMLLGHSVGFNVNISSLKALRWVAGLPFLSAKREGAQARRLVKELSIKTPSIAAPIGGLSGGNQQKAMIARWLGPNTRVLILDEPSRGVDIGAREEIHDAIRQLARNGVGIILISSDVEELAVIADRVVVLREGRVTGELVGDQVTESRIIELSYLDATEVEGGRA